MLKLDFESERRNSNHGVPHVSTCTQVCQADGPIRDASKESMKENSVTHDGVSLVKAGKLVQDNWGHSWEATQPGVTAVKKSSTDGNPTESVGDGQHVLPHLVDFPCMKKEPQTRNIAKEWKQRSNYSSQSRESLEAVKKMGRWEASPLGPSCGRSGYRDTPT